VRSRIGMDTLREAKSLILVVNRTPDLQLVVRLGTNWVTMD
jgi:hypothetical protein